MDDGTPGRRGDGAIKEAAPAYSATGGPGRRRLTPSPGLPVAPSPEDEAFRQALTGQRITGLSRRGKYLILHLDSGERLIVHLRMTGSLLLGPPAEPPPHASITWALDDGKVLHLTDLRRFATVWLVPDEAAVVGKLGPEPFEEAFSRETFAAQLARRRAPVKAVLLDQRVVAGLGNIYVDEALFEAGIHPQRLAHTLTPEEVRRLHAAITRVLDRGITNRGTSLRSFRDGSGARGRNQETLRVFRRAGQPCPNCGTPIERLKVGGRSSHFCPHCQPRTRQ